MKTNQRKMYEYENSRNGGRERVYLEDGKFFINSDWGRGFGEKRPVSKQDMKDCLAFTKAPAHVVSGILGE